MPELCDFAVVLDGEAQVNVPQVFTRKFNMGGRVANSQALLIFNVRDLGNNNVSVLVNDQNIGQLQSYRSTDDANWFSQTIVFNSNVLNGSNTINMVVISM